MAHVRQQIREAAAAAITGLASAGQRVYQSRVYPVSDSKLPCLMVNTDDETVSAASIGVPVVLERALTLSIRAVAKSSVDLDDTLDTMAAEVETAIGNSTLSGRVRSLVLEGIEVEMGGDADKPVGILTMKWRAVYLTQGNAPAVSI